MKSLLIIIVAIFIGGCDILPKKTEYINKYTLVRPNESLLKNCRITAPPDRTKYLVSKYPEKEEMLYGYSNALMTDIALCNAQWEELRKWTNSQEALYK